MAEGEIVQGLGYHAFFGRRPIAWGQSLVYSDANGNATYIKGSV